MYAAGHRPLIAANTPRCPVADRSPALHSITDGPPNFAERMGSGEPVVGHSTRHLAEATGRHPSSIGPLTDRCEFARSFSVAS